MGFLKRLFGGGGEKSSSPADPNGIYLYFRSRRAPDAVTKVRIDKQYDLNSDDHGYSWHKTIVDHKYFSRIQAIIRFDRSYNLIGSELEGGELISEEEYKGALAAAAGEEGGEPAEPGAAGEDPT